jgi:hypothetical protein
MSFRDPDCVGELMNLGCGDVVRSVLKVHASNPGVVESVCATMASLGEPVLSSDALQDLEQVAEWLSWL